MDLAPFSSSRGPDSAKCSAMTFGNIFLLAAPLCEHQTNSCLSCLLQCADSAEQMLCNIVTVFTVIEYSALVLVFYSLAWKKQTGLVCCLCTGKWYNCHKPTGGSSTTSDSAECQDSSNKSIIFLPYFTSRLSFSLQPHPPRHTPCSFLHLHGNHPDVTFCRRAVKETQHSSHIYIHTHNRLM